MGIKGLKTQYLPFFLLALFFNISDADGAVTDISSSPRATNTSVQSEKLTMSLSEFIELTEAEETKRHSGSKTVTQKRTTKRGNTGVLSADAVLVDTGGQTNSHSELTATTEEEKPDGYPKTKIIFSTIEEDSANTRNHPSPASSSPSLYLSEIINRGESGSVSDASVPENQESDKQATETEKKNISEEVLTSSSEADDADKNTQTAGVPDSNKQVEGRELKITFAQADEKNQPAGNTNVTTSYAATLLQETSSDDSSFASAETGEASEQGAMSFPWNGMLAPLTGPLDIYGAVNRAIAFHPDITESLGGLFQQKELVNQARANYLPQVSSGLSSGYRTTTERTDEAFNVNVSQLLYDFGKVSSTVDAAEFGVVRDRAAVLMAIDDLARDTARAFIEVLRYKELLDIANSFVSAVGDIQDLAAKRSEKGASSRSDEIQAKSRKHSAEATAMQYRSRLDVWVTTLENLVGADANIDVAGTFPDELNGACTRATEDFDSVPLVVMAEAEKAIAKANIKNAKAEILPTISLNADYDHYLNQGGDIALADDEYFTFTLDLRSKLYQGGALSARRRSAEYALNRAIASKKSALLDVERTLRESKVQSRVLSRRMKSLDARYDNIVKTQELYRKQYLSLGTRTLLDILNTEAEIYQSLFDIKNNFYELERLQIDCLHSISGLRSAFSINENLLQGVSINP